LKHKKVVITGIGAVTPIGIGKDEFWNSLINGVSGIKQIKHFDTTGLPTKIAGIVENFEEAQHVEKKILKFSNREVSMGIIATKMALEDAGLDITKEDKNRIGVFIGTSIGSQGWIYKQHISFLKHGYKSIDPFTSIAVYPNSASANLSLYFGFKGPSITNSNACTSSIVALKEAMTFLEEGIIDIAIIGGVEAPLYLPIVAALCNGRILSKNKDPKSASRPFDLKRDGIVISEGAGIIVLETEERLLSKKNKKNVYAEVKGIGITCDGYSPLFPKADALQQARAMQMAIDLSCLQHKDIDYISANALSAKAFDASETKAIKLVFKDGARAIPISSIKSMIGQPFGATSALQIIASALIFKNDKIPPTINYEFFDPECDLFYVPNKYINKKAKNILINSFAFGGKNVTAVITRYDN